MKPSRSFPASALIPLLLMSAPAAAQQIHELTPGDTVRVLTTQDTTLEGIFVSAADGTIRFSPLPGLNPLDVELASIRRLQVLRPGSRRDNIGSGAVAGMAAGFIYTAITFLRSRQTCSRECWAPAYALIIVVPSATAVGALFGAGREVKPRWETIKMRRDSWP